MFFVGQLSRMTDFFEKQLNFNGVQFVPRVAIVIVVLANVSLGDGEIKKF